MTKDERAKLVLARECFMEDKPDDYAPREDYKGGFHRGMELLSDVLVADAERRKAK